MLPSNVFAWYCVKFLTLSTPKPSTSTCTAVTAVTAEPRAVYVKPVILHWEDRLTAWSGYRDKVNIALRVIKVNGPVVIILKDIYLTNNSVTLLETKPEDLLDEKFESFVSSLFEAN